MLTCRHAIFMAADLEVRERDTWVCGFRRNIWCSEVCGERSMGERRGRNEAEKIGIGSRGGKRTERRVSRAAGRREWVVLIGQSSSGQLWG